MWFPFNDPLLDFARRATVLAWKTYVCAVTDEPSVLSIMTSYRRDPPLTPPLTDLGKAEDEQHLLRRHVLVPVFLWCSSVEGCAGRAPCSSSLFGTFGPPFLRSRSSRCSVVLSSSLCSLQKSRKLFEHAPEILGSSIACRGAKEPHRRPTWNSTGHTSLEKEFKACVDNAEGSIRPEKNGKLLTASYTMVQYSNSIRTIQLSLVGLGLRCWTDQVLFKERPTEHD